VIGQSVQHPELGTVLFVDEPTIKKFIADNHNKEVIAGQLQCEAALGEWDIVFLLLYGDRVWITLDQFQEAVCRTLSKGVD
jgi:hypothetical protein